MVFEPWRDPINPHLFHHGDKSFDERACDLPLGCTFIAQHCGVSAHEVFLWNEARHPASLMDRMMHAINTGLADQQRRRKAEAAFLDLEIAVLREITRSPE